MRSIRNYVLTSVLVLLLGSMLASTFGTSGTVAVEGSARSAYTSISQDNRVDNRKPGWRCKGIRSPRCPKDR